MKPILLHPCYFGPVAQFVELVKADSVVFENEDNYQKQTYRNRMYIYGANGRLLLNIPIKHSGDKSQHQKYRDVRLENDFQWQKQHWKSLQTAYRTSPFFEFYEDDFRPLYERPFQFLMDFNYHCLDLVMDALQLEKKYQKTSSYATVPQQQEDGRFLVEAKKYSPPEFEHYHQVFSSRYGFLNNLSILDLLFNEGPNTPDYLQRQASVLLP